MDTLYTIEEAKELTPKELLVSELLITSLTGNEISNKCNISLRTLKAHCKSIYIKTNTTNRIQYMAMVIKGITNETR